MTWHTEVVERLNTPLLSALFHNELAAIRISRFLPEEVCQKATRKIFAHGIKNYIDDPKMARVGITQAEHKYNQQTKDLYFLRAADADSTRRELFREHGDILSLLIDTLQSAWPGKVQVAFEESHGQHYFAGLVRVINRTLLHFDWAPHDAVNWTIGQICAQLAWNIYLQSSDSGGFTKIYHRPWLDQDEQYRLPDSYAYSTQLIQEYEFVEIFPQPGELVIFNSRNYHEVIQAEGEKQRVSVGSFIGLLEADNRLLLWS